MAKKNKYCTEAKILEFYNGLPENIRKHIPSSTLYNWRNLDPNEFQYFALNEAIRNHSKAIEMSVTYPKLFYAYARLMTTVMNVVETAKAFKAIRNSQKEAIITQAQKIKSIIPVDKIIKTLRISRQTYQSWVADTKANCSKSFIGICNRLNTQQITIPEVNLMKGLLTCKKFQEKSIHAIYAYAKRNDILNLCVGTWYKYNKRFQWKVFEKIQKPHKNKVGIRASAPNEIWHADITYFKTQNGVKHYIYLVIDNFSRHIISWKVSDKICKHIRKETLKEAYETASKLQTELNVTLIVDGGSENNNMIIDEFISNSQINMRKLIALKEIDFSNSMVEAINKTLKYNYLYKQAIHDSDDLYKSLKESISDYCYFTAHSKLDILTPSEVWFGCKINTKEYKRLTEKAIRDRIEHNRKNTCHTCVDLHEFMK